MPTPSDMIAQYIKIRDKITQMDDAHKNARRPYVKAKEAIENALKLEMDQAGLSQLGSKEVGTAYQKTNMFVKTFDAMELKRYIAEQIMECVPDNTVYRDDSVISDIVISDIVACMNLFTSAVSKEALKDHLSENNDTPPPGVEVSFETEVQIRKPT